MADSAYLPQFAIQRSDIAESPRHSAIVRITHWITTLSFFGLLVSGIAIVLAHPRLYWGETGNIGTPSLIDLPLPFVLVGQSGWGRYLHFLSAWVSVLTGLLYVLSGLVTGHFRRDLWGRATGRAVRMPGPERTYNRIQRLTYLAVVFVLFPLMIWTGLAMSPAITSVFPELVTVLGGQQSARTIHFFVANSLVLFLLVHLVKVYLAGFRNLVWAMITGGGIAGKEHA
jgi:thiosulfate reductase cytochrome b subunit